MLLAIDPGPDMSAYVETNANGGVVTFGYEKNTYVRAIINLAGRSNHELAIEMIASYGMPVGREVFETCLWIGRFLQAFDNDKYASLIYRKDVKLALCNSVRATDATIRQSLIDRYGPGKEKAIGRKASPGPLYGLSGDMWAALAVAETYRMQNI